MKLVSNLFLLAIGFGLLFSCGEKQRQSIEKNLDLLPPSQGGRGEVLIIMDSVKWRDTLGTVVRKVFNETVPALPQAEPMFSSTFVTASLFRGLLKRHRNIVIITTFDSQTSEAKVLQSNFTPDSRKKLLADSSSYAIIKENEYARDQTVMHLFAESDSTLMRKLMQHKNEIQSYFNTKEEQAIEEKLFKVLNEDMIEKFADHGTLLKIPKGYRFAKDTAGFMWVRFPEVNFDKNIFLAHQPYTSESQFATDSIIAWRDRIAKQHLYGDPENRNSFVRTEDLEPVVAEEVALDGQYAKKILGRWKTNNFTMGGSFVSYTFVDEQAGEMYYLEGFVYAPGEKKREYIRQLNTILRTAKR